MNKGINLKIQLHSNIVVSLFQNKSSFGISDNEDEGS